MMLAVGLVFLSSFLPVLIGTGASPDPYTEWHDGTQVLMPFRLPCSDVDSISGYFTHLATEIVGPWLGYLFMFGAAVTNIGIKQYSCSVRTNCFSVIGMFEAEMSSDAWQVAGMADNGQLPKVLARRNGHGVPLYGVLLSGIKEDCASIVTC
jgi:hypothetical protein